MEHNLFFYDGGGNTVAMTDRLITSHSFMIMRQVIVVFNNKEIYRIAMEQSAIDSNCKWEDFLKKDKVLHIALMQAMTILQQSNETYITQGI